jgi:hypothetical protein
MGAGFDFDQLQVDARAVSSAPDAAFEDAARR